MIGVSVPLVHIPSPHSNSAVSTKRPASSQRSATDTTAKRQSATPSPSTHPPVPPTTKEPDPPSTTEADIKDITVVQNRDLIKLNVRRKKSEFGAQYKFSDRDAHDGLVECRQFKNPNYELLMKERDAAVQAVPMLVAKHTQTPFFRKVNSAIQYEPADLESEWKGKFQSAPPLVEFMNSTFKSIETALCQNELLDIFRPDLPAPQEEERLFGDKSDNFIKEFQSFTDLEHSKNKAISAIDWMPNAKGMVAVACADNISFDERIYRQSGFMKPAVILIWNFVDPIHPQLILEAPSDVQSLRFNPQKGHILVAGCSNGQVLYYDLTGLLSYSGAQSIQATRPTLDDDSDSISRRVRTPSVQHTVASSIESSHKAQVLDMCWLPPLLEVGGKGTRAPGPDTTEYQQFITTSPDGQLLIWDTRFRRDAKEMDLIWVPLYRISLIRIETREEMTLSSFSIASFVSTKLACATEEGELVFADWNPTFEGNRVQRVLQCHHGPVRSLHRSPFFGDLLMTVGDWTVAVWKEGMMQPIFVSPHAGAAATTGKWSPTRPGVLYVGRADGFVDVWDFMDKVHSPTLSQQVASSAIISMEFPQVGPESTRHHSNYQIAIGDERGTLHLLEVPKSLARAAVNEKTLVDQFIRREQARVEHARARAVVRRDELFSKENNNITHEK